MVLEETDEAHSEASSSARPDRAAAAAALVVEEEHSDKEAPRAAPLGAEDAAAVAAQVVPPSGACATGRLMPDDEGASPGASSTVTTRRRPVDKPPSIFGSASTAGLLVARHDIAVYPRGRYTECSRGGGASCCHVNRVSDYDQSSDDDSEEYDLPGPPPRRLVGCVAQHGKGLGPRRCDRPSRRRVGGHFRRRRKASRPLPAARRRSLVPSISNCHARQARTRRVSSKKPWWCRLDGSKMEPLTFGESNERM